MHLICGHHRSDFQAEYQNYFHSINCKSFSTLINISVDFVVKLRSYVCSNRFLKPLAALLLTFGCKHEWIACLATAAFSVGPFSNGPFFLIQSFLYSNA